MEIRGVKIRIYGIVQGVGFRPFVHKEVRRFFLNGFIRNTSDGVEMEVEGRTENLKAFLDTLRTSHPKQAVIDRIEAEEYKELKHYPDFRIMESCRGTERQTLISPDIGICDACLKELFDPSDRRYRYPFINCTNCGPRFTIIRDIPYDRKQTTMSGFAMCSECESEYHDIDNRRYHAQPDCCPECGPKVWFVHAQDFSKTLSAGLAFSVPGHFPAGPSGAQEEAVAAARQYPQEEAVAAAKQCLQEGKIIAVKGLGGFHLACRIDKEDLVGTLRQRKQRDAKPFAVMVRDVETAQRYCHVNAREERALASSQRPIVLLRKKDPDAFRYISENNFIGVMLPYTPLHYLLFEEDAASFDALIMTSANLSDEPVIYKNEEALEKLTGLADGFLLHDREIASRCDDSLLWIVGGEEYFVRRSRGYVPAPLKVNVVKNFCRQRSDPKKQASRIIATAPHILACGAEQKAGFALLKGKEVFLSQHIGDLKNMETLSHYEQQVAHFENMFSVRPAVIACDLHPDYLSTAYAEQKAGQLSKAAGMPHSANRLIKVQHHHAHMASCMADNGLQGRTVGIIWDGTGLGTDGTVWGGEFLLGDYTGFERVGSILPFRLPGGDRAAKELWRPALSVSLLSTEQTPSALPEKKEIFSAREQFFRNVFGDDRLRTGKMMIGQELNSPVCTSMGRLFDAVAFLLGITETASYEGQGAVLLEAAADRFPTKEAFPFSIVQAPVLRFDFRPMIRELLDEIIQCCGPAGEAFSSAEDNGIRRGQKESFPATNIDGENRSRLAAKFMNTLVRMAVDMTDRIAKESGVRQVVLSGGTFQNQYLLKEIKKQLAEKGFQVYHHSRVAANDEGIAFGQAVVAAYAEDMWKAPQE